MEWQNFHSRLKTRDWNWKHKTGRKNSHFRLESLNRLLVGHLIEVQKLLQTLHNNSMIQTQKHVGMNPLAIYFCIYIIILYFRVVRIVIWGKVCSNARLYFLSAPPLLRYEYREAEVATPKLLKTQRSKIFVSCKVFSLKIQHIWNDIFINISRNILL